ncbi:hypothetical protein TMEN_2767 [Trichophyton mentagrophytes]|nr:hypothetical protein TMEN_2767 [Trichophyton mentagrophytes]
MGFKGQYDRRRDGDWGSAQVGGRPSFSSQSSRNGCGSHYFVMARA